MSKKRKQRRPARTSTGEAQRAGGGNAEGARKRAPHWLQKPETIRKIWIVSIAVLIATVLGDFVVAHHPHFGIDGTFGFGAWFGFVSCVAMVLFAKGLGMLLKRQDDYYASDQGVDGKLETRS